MRKSKRWLKEYMTRIATLYGARVIFYDDVGGSAELDGRINVGTGGTRRDFISTFCHELGHHTNQINGKFPIYHRCPGAKWRSIVDMSPEWKISYAYRAEVYTDKVARQLCKTWFPGVKYHGYYNGDQRSRGFMQGYYLLWAYGKETLTPPPLL